MLTETTLKNFLEIPYDKLEEMNLRAQNRADSTSSKILEKEYRDYLKKEKRLKAVTVCFSDIEGRFHMIDYDKQFLLESSGNLTFDGSSIKGFTELHESDLRLELDWTSIRWLPSDVFGPGKVIIFSFVLNNDRTPYRSDFRGLLKKYSSEIEKRTGYVGVAAPEIEGMLVDGVDAEEKYQINKGFKLISAGGYFHSLPLDKLKRFIDRSAEAQRAMGFKNEKDHPEVAPSQFELNFSKAPLLRICDNIQLYKLICRQIATSMEMTATFLPKPISTINGNGMHMNFSLQKASANAYFDKSGKDGLSSVAWDGVSKLLNHAPELSLILNSSVNSYRRLDPNFEAPNQIKVSSKDRGSMIRIPLGNEKSARIEIRSVGPDTNPYLVLYSIVKTIFEGEKLKKDKTKRDRLRYLPGNINDAIKLFKASDFISKILGEDSKNKYSKYKQLAADRSPKELGKTVKRSEVIYHHEITNQMLWNDF